MSAGARVNEKPVVAEHPPIVVAAAPPEQKGIDQLRSEYEVINQRLEIVRQHLRAANAYRSRNTDAVDSKEKAFFQRRIARGESFQDIEKSLAKAARQLWKVNLQKELPYREAQVQALKAEVTTPARPGDILQTINALNSGQKLDATNPVMTHIQEKINQRQSLAAIQQEQLKEINARKQLEEILSVAQNFKLFGRWLNYPEAKKRIEQRLAQGEPIEDILNKVQANIDRNNEINRKKDDLGFALRRVKEIPLQQASLTTFETSQNRILDQQQLQQLRQQLAPTQRVTSSEAIAPTEPLTGIQIAINAWSGARNHLGQPILEHADALKFKHTFSEVKMGHLNFIIPQDLDPIQVQRLMQIYQEVATKIGVPLAQLKDLNILIVPKAEFCKRPAAFPNGEHIILNAENPNWLFIASHELVHAYLGQLYGASKSQMASEGAAVFFGKRGDNDPINKVTAMAGHDDLVNLAPGKGVGLSNSQMVDMAGINIPQAEKYEYSYGMGAYFAQYIVQNYGKEAYLRFYQQTCTNDMIDTQSGQTLIFNGQIAPGARQRDINAQALRHLGLNPDQIEKQFNEYIDQNAPKNLLLQMRSAVQKYVFS